MSFYTYILRSQKTGRLYIGQAVDCEKRLREHNSGQTKSTSTGIPWDILYAKSFETRLEALALERLLKSWKNKQRILFWVERQRLGGM